MSDAPGDRPLPHPELHSQKPLIFNLAAGDALYRHHQSVHDPIYFGKSGNYRFDDPNCPAGAPFGVLYTGADLHCYLSRLIDDALKQNPAQPIAARLQRGSSLTLGKKQDSTHEQCLYYASERSAASLAIPIALKNQLKFPAA